MKNLPLIVLVFLAHASFAQKYITEKSKVSFFSAATLEDITATNSKSNSIFNSDDGGLVYVIPINEFQFDKSLMQEHFNEKYMESEKYPKSTFKGTIVGFKKGQGKQNVKAKGMLKIHGVEKEVEVPGTIEFKNGKVYIVASFIVKLADYKVKIPKLMWQNIAEQVEVKIDFEYKKYEG